MDGRTTHFLSSLTPVQQSSTSSPDDDDSKDGGNGELGRGIGVGVAIMLCVLAAVVAALLAMLWRRGWVLPALPCQVGYRPRTSSQYDDTHSTVTTVTTSESFSAHDTATRKSGLSQHGDTDDVIPAMSTTTGSFRTKTDQLDSEGLGPPHTASSKRLGKVLGDYQGPGMGCKTEYRDPDKTHKTGVVDPEKSFKADYDDPKKSFKTNPEKKFKTNPEKSFNTEDYDVPEKGFRTHDYEDPQKSSKTDDYEDPEKSLTDDYEVPRKIFGAAGEDPEMRWQTAGLHRRSQQPVSEVYELLAVPADSKNRASETDTRLAKSGSKGSENEVRLPARVSSKGIQKKSTRDVEAAAIYENTGEKEGQYTNINYAFAKDSDKDKNDDYIEVMDGDRMRCLTMLK